MIVLLVGFWGLTNFYFSSPRPSRAIAPALPSYMGVVNVENAGAFSHQLTYIHVEIQQERGFILNMTGIPSPSGRGLG